VPAGRISQTDEASLLHIAFVLGGKERLDHVLSLLSRERLERVIEIAGSEQLWPEVLDLLGQVDERFRGKLADIAAEQDAQAASRHDIWQFVLPLEPLLPPESQHTLATIAGEMDLHVLERATAAAREYGLWVPLIGLPRARPRRLSGVRARLRRRRAPSTRPSVPSRA